MHARASPPRAAARARPGRGTARRCGTRRAPSSAVEARDRQPGARRAARSASRRATARACGAARVPPAGPAPPAAGCRQTSPRLTPPSVSRPGQIGARPVRTTCRTVGRLDDAVGRALAERVEEVARARLPLPEQIRRLAQRPAQTTQQRRAAVEARRADSRPRPGTPPRVGRPSRASSAAASARHGVAGSAEKNPAANRRKLATASPSERAKSVPVSRLDDSARPRPRPASSSTLVTARSSLRARPLVGGRGRGAPARARRRGRTPPASKWRQRLCSGTPRSG